MRASTLFVATFTLWIVAKGNGGKYWKLATTSDVGGVSSSAPSSAPAVAPASPLAGAMADLNATGANMMQYFSGAK